MKTCKTCNETKSLEEFSKRSRNKDGYELHCKVCLRKVHQEWVNNNPEKARESWRKASKKNYSTKNYRVRHLAKYGLTEQGYESLLLSQNKLCAICNEDKPLCIDHDHETGKVRGLLCTSCNTGLGKLGDSITSLQNAINYLARVQVNNNPS